MNGNALELTADEIELFEGIEDYGSAEHSTARVERGEGVAKPRPVEDVPATRRGKGQCTACGSNDPDGPTDSNGDHWCTACRDAAVSG